MIVPDPSSELLLAGIAKPKAASLDKRVFRRIAAWARNLAVRPAQLNRVGKAAVRVGEISNGILQCFGVLVASMHKGSLKRTCGVKPFLALICGEGFTKWRRHP